VSRLRRDTGKKARLTYSKIFWGTKRNFLRREEGKRGEGHGGVGAGTKGDRKRTVKNTKRHDRKVVRNSSYFGAEDLKTENDDEGASRQVLELGGGEKRKGEKYADPQPSSGNSAMHKK